MTKQHFQVLLVSLILMFSTAMAFAQEPLVIWPGDVNNDGIVDGIDFLYWGIASGAEGEERIDTEQGIEWVGYELDADADWDDQTFPNGLSYAYADCNGDGEVDEGEDDDYPEEDEIDDYEDVFAIIENWGLTHDIPTPPVYTDGVPGFDPPFQIESPEAIVNGGEMLDLNINLGSAALPITDFYGISFDINFDPALVEEGFTEFEIPQGSWIDPPGFVQGENSRFIMVEDFTNGKVTISLSRFDSVGVDGFGQIGRFSIVIVDNVNSLIIDSLDLTIDSVKLLTPDFGEVLVAFDPIILVNPATGNGDPITSIFSPEAEPFTLFPNPTSQLLNWQSAQPISGWISIYDATGRMRRPELAIRDEKTILLDVSNLSPGVYILHLRTDGRPVAMRRFVKLE